MHPFENSARRRQLARIHMAAQELGLEDETYRSLLEGVTGKRSAADMTETERRAVLGRLARGGSRVAASGAPSNPKPGARNKSRHWPLRDTRGTYRAIRAKCFNLKVRKPEACATAILRRQGGPDRLEWASDLELRGVLASPRRQEARGEPST